MSNAPPAPPEDDPEAGGFGREQGRMHLEWIAALVIVIATPLALIWGAKVLAHRVAQSLPVSVDEKLGAPTWHSLTGAPRATCEGEAQGYVERVAKPLVDALGAPFEFRFAVADTPDVNAFALPGGYVIVNRGLLEKAESGEEVAAVLAHELHHVTLRHSTERVVRELGTTALLSLFFGGGDLQAPVFTIAQLTSLAYGREQETDADERGLALLIQAGISPAGMGTFFTRLQESGGTPPELLSTHPDPGDRAKRAKRAAEGFVARVTLPAPGGVSCQ